jgi:hypothetical protein
MSIIDKTNAYLKTIPNEYLIITVSIISLVFFMFCIVGSKLGLLIRN